MRGMIQIGRRAVRSATVAVAAALAIGGVRRARQTSYKQSPKFTPAPRPSGGGPRGFVATIEDTSNDRGFVAGVEDRSNDRGFHQPAPVRVPEADSSRPRASSPGEPASGDSDAQDPADSPPEV